MLKCKSNNHPLLHFLDIIGETMFCAPSFGIFTEAKRNEGNSIQIVKWSFYALCNQNLYWLFGLWTKPEPTLQPTKHIARVRFSIFESFDSTILQKETSCDFVSFYVILSWYMIMHCHFQCAEQIDFRFSFDSVFILDLIRLLNCKRLHSLRYIYAK